MYISYNIITAYTQFQKYHSRGINAIKRKRDSIPHITTPLLYLYPIVCDIILSTVVILYNKVSVGVCDCNAYKRAIAVVITLTLYKDNMYSTQYVFVIHIYIYI